MPRKGENIFKRKDGRWEGRYIKRRENGKIIYGYVFAKSYSEAKSKKLAAISKLSEKSKSSENQPIMQNIVIQWLNELKPIRKVSTIAKYESQLKKHIIPNFGSKRIDEISNNDLKIFCKNLLSKKLSPKTVSDILSRMKSIRKFAISHGYDVKYFPNCVEIPQKTGKIRVLSPNEERQLIHYLKSNPSNTNLGILICMFTGIRIGELCALKWSDFSFEDGEFHIKRTMQRLNTPDEKSIAKTHIEIGKPKSQSSVRTIPIPNSIMKLLQTAYVKDAYLLSGHSKYFIEPRTMENRFKNKLSKLFAAK